MPRVPKLKHGPLFGRFHSNLFFLLSRGWGWGGGGTISPKDLLKTTTTSHDSKFSFTLKLKSQKLNSFPEFSALGHLIKWIHNKINDDTYFL